MIIQNAPNVNANAEFHRYAILTYFLQSSFRISRLSLLRLHLIFKLSSPHSTRWSFRPAT